MRRLAVVALLAGLLLSVTGLASASDASRYPEASPTFAMKRAVVFDPQGWVHHRWRLWRTVENYDRRLGMLNMWVGRCDRHPNAGCVRVDQVWHRGGSFWGQWRYRGWWRGRIVLNRFYGPHRHVMCHEIGHALGLNHHWRGGGCVQAGRDAPWRKRASYPEIREIRSTYRQYR